MTQHFWEMGHMLPLDVYNKSPCNSGVVMRARTFLNPNKPMKISPGSSTIKDHIPPLALWRRAETWNEPPHDKINKMAYAPSEDSDQPGRPPSLIRVFAVRMKKAWVLSYPLSVQQRLWSDWADAQADLSLRWAHSHFVGFVMRRLKSQTVDNQADGQ